jgi:hypothetical protein
MIAYGLSGYAVFSHAEGGRKSAFGDVRDHTLTNAWQSAQMILICII